MKEEWIPAVGEFTAALDQKPSFDLFWDDVRRLWTGEQDVIEFLEQQDIFNTYVGL